MNAVSSREYLRHCKMLKMPSKCFQNLWKKFGQECPSYSIGSEGTIAPYALAEKEHKMMLNHGYPTFSSLPFISGDHVYCINQLSLKSKQV